MARDPQATALVFGEESLTYQELNARANRLAHHLIGLGVGPESLVGIALERSLEMVVALLGILKAGGAYLPLDPDYPAGPAGHMLADAAPALVLTTSGSARSAVRDNRRCLASMRSRRKPCSSQAPAHNPSDEAERTASFQHPAYVIYTSGSTGAPRAWW